MVSFCGWVQLSQGYRATTRRQFTFYHSDKSSSPQLHPNFMISLSQFPIIEKNQQNYYTIKQLDQVSQFLKNLNFFSTRKLDINKTMDPVKKFD